MTRSMLTVRLAMSVCAVAAVFSVPAAGGETARGVVYVDRDGDGRRDGDEPGLGGVVVSNQFDVVLTDERGAYELPVTDDTIIFVSTPAGYRTPMPKDNLPRFYYIHKPGGSPPVHYGGVAPTGALPDAIDFGLVPADNSNRFTVIAMADPQPQNGMEVGYVRDDVISELVGTEAAFAITLGDIVSDNLSLYYFYNDVAGKIGIPVFNVIGNHDMNYDAADDRDSDETFHRHFGPNYYSWNYGLVHFVALDTVEWRGPGEGNGNYRGKIGERQLAWLKNDIAHVPADRLIVLTMHIPLLSAAGYAVADKDDLFDLLEDRPKVLALAGHAHFHEHNFFGPDDGWHGKGWFHELICGTVSGSWWSGPKDYRGIPIADMRDGTPNGYVIVSFDGADYTTTFKAAGASIDEQMRIYPPGSTGPGEDARKRLLVNVWDGSERCRVEYAFDHGEYRPMERSVELDPVAIAILSGPLKGAKSWARPTDCQHIWAADLAEPLPHGTHVVTIRVHDHFGRVREQSKVFSD